jgi:ABC-2 type transport system ATP-binding protein
MNFQSPYVNLPRRLSVRHNLEVYAALYGVTKIRARIDALAEELRLTELLDRPTGQLSAGQMTRVSLAKALVNEPRVLLLDEPTASLDPDTADWVRGLLETYQARTGAAILLASHNMGEVERLAAHVLMMKQGKIVDRGSPAELLERYGREDLEDVFLDIARNRGRAEAGA